MGWRCPGPACRLSSSADPTVWFVSWKCSRRSRPDAWVSPSPNTARAAMAMRMMRRCSAARPGDGACLWHVAGGARGLFAVQTWVLMPCQYCCRRTRAVRLISRAWDEQYPPHSHHDAPPSMAAAVLSAMAGAATVNRWISRQAELQANRLCASCLAHWTGKPLRQADGDGQAPPWLACRPATLQNLGPSHPSSFECLLCS
jgi:hypothetical protein